MRRMQSSQNVGRLSRVAAFIAMVFVVGAAPAVDLTCPEHSTIFTLQEEVFFDALGDSDPDIMEMTDKPSATAKFSLNASGGGAEIWLQQVSTSFQVATFIATANPPGGGWEEAIRTAYGKLTVGQTTGSDHATVVFEDDGGMP